MPAVVHRYDKENGKWVESRDSATHILLPKSTERIPIIMHRPLPDNATYCSVTIIHTASDKWYVSLCVSYDLEIPERNIDLECSIGLDYSSPYFYVDNQGMKGGYPRYYRQAESKIKKLNRSLSRKVFGSKNYEKARIKLARAHEKVANKRADWQWKKAHEIVDNHDYTFIETLDMTEIASRDSDYKLGKPSYDNGWYSFTEKMDYIAEQQGKKVYRLNKYFPSSKMCSKCENIHTNLKLSDRMFVCPHCGFTLDRDLNAAINIRTEGIMRIRLTNIIEPQELRG